MAQFRYLFLFFSGLFLGQALLAQPGSPRFQKVHFVKSLDARLSNAGDSIHNALAENGTNPDKYPVTADLSLNGKETMHFSQAYMVEDTLRIRIYEKTPAFDHEVLINVVGERFHTTYAFQYPDSGKRILIQATDQVLLLNSGLFSSGNVIHGRLNFRGALVWDPVALFSWNSRDSWMESSYLLKGDFIFEIK
ncbi:MAG: hypothetical protein AAF570_08200 [Bacteroidota bacterium]